MIVLVKDGLNRFSSPHLTRRGFNNCTFALLGRIDVLGRPLFSFRIHVKNLSKRTSQHTGPHRASCTALTSTTLPTRYGSTLFCLILSPFSRTFSFIVSASCWSRCISERITCTGVRVSHPAYCTARRRDANQLTRISLSISRILELISSADAESSSGGRSPQVSAGGSWVTSIASGFDRPFSWSSTDIRGFSFEGGWSGGGAELMFVDVVQVQDQRSLTRFSLWLLSFIASAINASTSVSGALDHKRMNALIERQIESEPRRTAPRSKRVMCEPLTPSCCSTCAFNVVPPIPIRLVAL